ncbi:MAG: hypothetical protein Q9198_006118 [Flavoplaca austrocitrina]
MLLGANLVWAVSCSLSATPSIKYIKTRSSPCLKDVLTQHGVAALHFAHDRLPPIDEATRWTAWVDMEREQVERVVHDYMFNSEFTKEDLDLLDLRPAGNLFPTLVNNQGTLRLRAEKQAQLSWTGTLHMGMSNDLRDTNDYD